MSHFLALPGIISSVPAGDPTPILNVGTTLSPGLVNYYATNRNTTTRVNFSQSKLCWFGDLSGNFNNIANSTHTSTQLLDNVTPGARMSLSDNRRVNRTWMNDNPRFAPIMAFPEPVLVNSYALLPSHSNADGTNTFRYGLPVSWTLEASNDQVNWTPIDVRSITDPTSFWNAATHYTSAANIRLYTFPIVGNSTYYQYYRFNTFLSILGDKLACLSAIEFYGTPSNSVNLNLITTNRTNFLNFSTQRRTTSATFNFSNQMEHPSRYITSSTGSPVTPYYNSVVTIRDPGVYVDTPLGVGYRMTTETEPLVANAGVNSCMGGVSGTNRVNVLWVWFKRSQVSSATEEIIYMEKNQSTPFHPQWILSIKPDNTLNVFYRGASVTRGVAVGTINDTNWHLFVWMLFSNNSNATDPLWLYLDGVRTVTTTRSISSFTSACLGYLGNGELSTSGSSTPNLANPFRGTILNFHQFLSSDTFPVSLPFSTDSEVLSYWNNFSPLLT